MREEKNSQPSKSNEHQRRYYPLLGAARMLAAFVVLVHHISVRFPAGTATGWWSGNYHKSIDFIGSFNYEAVLFFFLLSGFVVTNSVLRQGSKFSARQYFIRRAGRILPVYWLSLLFTGIVAILLHKSLDLAGLAGNFFFLQTPGYTGGWFLPWMDNGPLWSLSYEVFYYLLFGLAMVLFPPTKKPAMGMILIFSLVWTGSVFIKSTECLTLPYVEFGLLLPVWMLGSIVAYLNQGGISDFALKVIVSVLSFVGGVGCFFGSSLGYSYLMAVVFFAVMVFLTRTRGWFMTVVEHSAVIKWLDFLGAGSYASYALHYPLLLLLADLGLGHLSVWAIMLPFLIVCTRVEKSLHFKLK